MTEFIPGKLYRAYGSFSVKPENYYMFSQTRIITVNMGDILLFVRNRKYFLGNIYLEEEAIFLHKNRLIVPFYNISDEPEMWVKKV